MDDFIIELKNVTKKFPGIIANDDVSLGIKKGEIFAVLGENGAGKSTLMSMIFGMYEPDGGEIFIRGKQEKITSPNDAYRLNIGMVHQHFKLVSEYTITQNIVLGNEPIKKKFGLFPTVDLKEANAKVAELSEKYGLQVNPTDKIKDVPVSIMQRVEILKMLYKEAEILIFDEPTAVLTPQEIEYLLEIILNLQQSGKTIILITHKLDEIKKIANRCAILRKGKLIDVRNVADLTTQDMARLMVGADVSFELPKEDHSFGDVILDVQNLSVRTIKDVVKNVSFQIHAGEIFSLAGVSGNGQTEIADAISGIIKSSGQIFLNGVDISNSSVRDRAEIGYIPEDRHKYGLVLDFDISNNAVLRDYYKERFSKNNVLQKHEFTDFAQELIDKYDIRCANGPKTNTRSMSGGNQQKIIIARETARNSKLLIFVQPTRGLDIGAIQNIHEKILSLRNENTAILLISLELDEVMQLSDTIGVIYNGEIQTIKKASDLSKEEVGEFMMGVHE
ncbi:MAG: heme ABC transporter ATP-binding protein [Candidatus Epulonipiscioides saccharophilum]|nr:MAG: heme ABC transporter ATP-binding protein [Epulopiscium sp. AS2M-Bin001]